ncbi:galactosylgalactosylxylosylprotein 3-beta-glucuronosyltransferase 1 isoform X2 [Anas acuta]|uniref:galactosylgalactosylxylosylprotein 3-beta-glucuronosyltransferase 1 isoform X2 n=1 Tax=Anas acuta TaxID=28680 RepID=UPI0035C8C0A4
MVMLTVEPRLPRYKPCCNHSRGISNILQHWIHFNTSRPYPRDPPQRVSHEAGQWLCKLPREEEGCEQGRLPNVSLRFLLEAPAASRRSRLLLLVPAAEAPPNLLLQWAWTPRNTACRTGTLWRCRPVQKAELTRLANTLLHVPNLHWILVEDSQRRTPLITRLLRDTGLNYTHLNVETPRNYKLRGDMRDPRIPRGTMQRNLALRWLRETFNRNNSQPGIVYFADDDNTYSLELFEEMRSTRKVSVWPVAFVGGLRYESPKVNAAGKVYGWKTVFDPHRPFAIDMAGFAVNLRLILQRSQAYFKLRGVKGGYQESSLLRELVTLNDLEPKAANCTKILVWHTRTEKPVLVNEGKKGFTDPNVEI